MTRENRDDRLILLTGATGYEIGGADQVSFAGIMRAYAPQRGMRIRMILVSAVVKTAWSAH